MKLKCCGFLILFFTSYELAGLSNFKGIPIEELCCKNNICAYDNGNMKTNGELMVVEHVAPKANVIFDVGANVGEWSSYVRKTNNGADIYAFEPIPDIYSILLARLGDKAYGLHTHQIALGCVNAKKDLYVYAKNIEFTGMSSFYRREEIIEKNFNLVPTKISVNVRSLDSFCNDYVIRCIDFLKIDTEGSEFDVLKGAAKLLQTGAIKVIQFEYGGTYASANIKLHDVYMFLKSFGYHVFQILPNKLIHIAQWVDELENYRYSNYLAISFDSLNEKGN